MTRFGRLCANVWIPGLKFEAVSYFLRVGWDADRRSVVCAAAAGAREETKRLKDEETAESSRRVARQPTDKRREEDVTSDVWRVTRGGQVLAAHFALYAWPALSLLRGRRWVFHFHGPWSIESSAEGQSGIAARAKFLLERSVYRRASRFVVLSQAFATLLSERFGVPGARISVVPGGVDLDRFRPQGTRQELRQKLGWESDKRIVLTVRRLAKRMGLESLIEAFAEVAGQFPDVVLYIAGKGAERGALERALEERGLGARVKFLGFVADEDLPAVYAAADETVVPSQE